MARTKQTARRSTGGKSRGRVPISPTFYDHDGDPYTVEGGLVHTLNGTPVIEKLSIHLYTLSECKTGLAEIAQGLLKSGCYEEIFWRKERRPRIDVYPSPKGSIEECIEHHRREKVHRQKAALDWRQRAAEAVPISPDDEPEDTQEKRYEAVRSLRGKEPLPHIVPTWCRTSRNIIDYRPFESQRYRSFILVVPEDCITYEDVSSKGIWIVRFDQDLSPAMDTDLWDADPDEDQLVDTEHGWVEVDKLPDGHLGPPVNIKRACIHRVTESLGTLVDKTTGHHQQIWCTTEGCEVNLGRVIALMMSKLGDCVYRNLACEGCDEGKRGHECEIEL